MNSVEIAGGDSLGDGLSSKYTLERQLDVSGSFLIEISHKNDRYFCIA